MVEPHHLTVGSIVPRKRHSAFLRRLYRSPRWDTDVDSRMELRPSSPHRMPALAKGRGELALHGPDETRAGLERCLGEALNVALQRQQKGGRARGGGLV